MQSDKHHKDVCNSSKGFVVAHRHPEESEVVVDFALVAWLAWLDDWW